VRSNTGPGLLVSTPVVIGPTGGGGTFASLSVPASTTVLAC
jgi:hypothetical protein